MAYAETLQNSFSGKLMEVLDHIEYRRVEGGEDMEAIARMRYKAYKAHAVLPISASNLIDDVDFDDHAYVFGVYYYEELISTIRLHHVTPDHRVCQAAGIFPEEIDALLDAGLTLIDPARFAADPAVSGEMPWIPYLTLRPSIVAAAYFNADRVLQHVRPPHAAFYRRVFYADTVVERRMTETYGFELTLMATNTKEVGRTLLTRFPFFISNASERRMMFSRHPADTLPPLTIVPTARFVPEGSLGVDLPL